MFFKEYKIIIGDEPSEIKYKELFAEIQVGLENNDSADIVQTLFVVNREQGKDKMVVEVINDKNEASYSMYVDVLIKALTEAKESLFYKND